jgi:hypothetical protein
LFEAKTKLANSNLKQTNFHPLIYVLFFFFTLSRFADTSSDVKVLELLTPTANLMGSLEN